RVHQLLKSKLVAFQPKFSPDGQSVAFAIGDPDKKGGSIYILPKDKGEPRRLTNESYVWDSAPSFSNDGSKVGFVRAHRYRHYSTGGMVWDDYDIYIQDVDGDSRSRLTHEKYYGAGRPSFGNNDNVLFYDARGRYGLGRSITTIHSIIPADAKTPNIIIPISSTDRNHGSFGSDPNISRDGKQITFITDRRVPFEYDVCIMKTDGSDINCLNVTRISHYNQQPTFLPDGKTILFLAGTDKNLGNRAIYSLWQVDTDGRNAEQIADSSLFTHPQRWKMER
ncbi:MAG TPA: hypothetical protein VH815_09040, partial [Acidobacteriota bacterium]